VHAHTHIHTHIYTDTLTSTLMHTHMVLNRRISEHTHAHTRTHLPQHIHKRTHAHAHACMHARPAATQVSRCLSSACAVLLGVYAEMHGRHMSIMVRRSVAATPWLHHKVRRLRVYARGCVCVCVCVCACVCVCMCLPVSMSMCVHVRVCAYAGVCVHACHGSTALNPCSSQAQPLRSSHCAMLGDALACVLTFSQSVLPREFVSDGVGCGAPHSVCLKALVHLLSPWSTRSVQMSALPRCQPFAPYAVLCGAARGVSTTPHGLPGVRPEGKAFEGLQCLPPHTTPFAPSRPHVLHTVIAAYLLQSARHHLSCALPHALLSALKRGCVRRVRCMACWRTGCPFPDASLAMPIRAAGAACAARTVWPACGKGGGCGGRGGPAGRRRGSKFTHEQRCGCFCACAKDVVHSMMKVQHCVCLRVCALASRGTPWQLCLRLPELNVRHALTSVLGLHVRNCKIHAFITCYLYCAHAQFCKLPGVYVQVFVCARLGDCVSVCVCACVCFRIVRAPVIASFVDAHQLVHLCNVPAGARAAQGPVAPSSYRNERGFGAGLLLEVR